MAHVNFAIDKIRDLSNADLMKLIWQFCGDVGDATFTSSD